MLKEPIKLRPDQELAANPTENAWIQANAGTGKTSVLTQRLLRILFQSPDCSSTGILCLTYTNAGAGEMRYRILESLRDWATFSDDQLREFLDGISMNRPATDADLAHAREIFFKYIDNPDMLKVKTIHSFCEEILRRFPLEAGLSPAWSLVSDAAQRVLLQDTFDRLINSPIANERVLAAFSHIVDRVSEYSMGKLLELLSDQYKCFFQVKDVEKYREYFIGQIKNYLGLNRSPRTDVSDEELEAIINVAQTIQDERALIKKAPLKTLTSLIKTVEQYIENRDLFQEYKDVFLKKDGGMRTALMDYDIIYQEQLRLFELEQYKVNQVVLADTIALFDLSAAFATMYQRLKQARNLLDFEDMILYTHKLFTDPETMGWVLSQLDISLSHILIDEAQDTSPMQWRIIRMLSGDFFAEGDTQTHRHAMLVVGDTKQSIFGFQDAEPAEFARSRDEIAALLTENQRTMHDVTLSENFRSTEPILKTVDKFFSDSGVIDISGFVNNTHKCMRMGKPGAVELHKAVIKKDTDTTIKQYISTIANKIHELIQSGKCTPQDIMVLVQRRHPYAAPLVTELKRLGVEVAGSDRIVLPDFPAVRDLLNLVRFCLDTADDYSLCCVLKSPLFYLKEQDIFNLCQKKNLINSERRSADKYVSATTVYQVLETENPDIYARLSDYINVAKFMAPYSFFSHVLNNNNVRQNFIAALGDQVIDPLEEFMTISLSYERTMPGTLRHFLKWFITGDSQIKRDMDAASGVRIVTVHSSKGLQSNYVFLIDTTRTPKSSNVFPIDGKSEMPVWLWTPQSTTSARCNDAADDLMRHHLAEYYRLLYVAMTRARDELYIYGYESRCNVPATESWHAQLWRVLADDSPTEYIRITNEDIK